MANPYIGEIRLGGWNFAPVGWAFCNGATMAISQNSTLFNLIGTTYGGNGQSTFQLPNLQGRVPIHQGTGGGQTFVIGQAGGTETVTLTSGQLPAHNHGFAVNQTGGTLNAPGSNFVAGATQNTYSNASGNESMGAVIGNNGGSQPHANVQPFLCVTYIISLFGIYPSQN